jgi:hypothetical protein
MFLGYQSPTGQMTNWLISHYDRMNEKYDLDPALDEGLKRSFPLHCAPHPVPHMLLVILDPRQH